MLLLGMLLAISVVIKFDTVVFPAFYFFAHAKSNNWRQVGIEAAGLFAIVVGVYVALVFAFPVPVDQSRMSIASVASIVKQNIAHMIAKNIAFPPLLGYAAPLVMSFFHLKARDRFLHASVGYACALAVIFFFFSFFQEIRAQLVILVLIMSSGLLTVQGILEPRTQENAR